MLKIVTDFDGTVTDILQESSTFELAYLELFAKKFDISLMTLINEVQSMMIEIDTHPGKYGWVNDGIIMADAHSDPYLYVQTAATLAIHKFKKIEPNDIIFSQALTEIFVAAYAKSGVVFQPYAKEYLQTLDRKTNLTIVTNSKTDSVLKKLAMLLGSDHNIKVVGNAQKFKPYPNWDAVASSILLPGFPREVYLRRKQYADVLASLGSVDAVCGDIYELDLAYPEYIGIETVLVYSSMTPVWEIDHYQYHPNGFATPSLQAAHNYLLTS